MRFNDGKVSPQGTLMLGRMSSDWRSGGPGRVYRLEPGSDTLLEVMKPEEVNLPNGMTWDQRRGVVYFIDSGAESVVAYTADARGMPVRGADGKLEGRRVVHVPTGLATVPDGLTMDADGRLWVARAESGAVVCYDPDTGAEVRRATLPCRRPTACTFGDRDLAALYVTTRVESGSDASPHHGALVRVRIPGVRGADAAYCFRL